jgi:phage host-nuclease inhibitor protein Gam
VTGGVTVAIKDKITTVAEAGIALATLAAAQREVERLTLGLEKSIATLKTRAAEKAADFQLVVKSETARLKDFAEHNTVLFENKKSLDLDHGKIGFQHSSSLDLIIKKDKWEEVLYRLENALAVLAVEASQEKDRAAQAELTAQAALISQAIRIKKEVNKDALKTWSDDRLAGIGVKVKSTDSFFVELAKEKIHAQESGDTTTAPDAAEAPAAEAANQELNHE